MHKPFTTLMTTAFTVLAATIVVLSTTSISVASPASSARSVAMGRAHVGMAAGLDAARFNPANLGLKDFHQTGLEIVGFGANIQNNSFTLDDYNHYTGAFLTESDKADILNKIPQEGLTFSGEADFSALSFSKGSFAVSFEGYGAAEVNLNRDVIDLLLNGNVFGDSIVFLGSYSEAVGYASVGLSYGYPLYSLGTREISVGATVKYIRGFGVEEILQMEGLASTLETGFEGEGRMVARTASGGSGYAVDLGGALKLNDTYTTGVSFRNFLSKINWSDNPEEHGYIFNFDTVTVDNMDGDFVVSDDYSRSIESFSTGFPSVMTVGIGKNRGKLMWAVDWEQGFRRGPGASSKPRIAGGLEWVPLPFLPLRTGFSTGGNRTTSFSFGGGLAASAFYLDIAAVTGSSFSPGSARGVNLALTSGIMF